MGETILRAYKTKLVLNNRERGLMLRCAGAARYVYNWALADRMAHYEAGEPTGYYEQKRRFNATKDELCPWIREIPYTITENAFRNLDTAYKNFFRRVKQGAEKKGFPKFKSRKHPRQSFTLSGTIKVDESAIRLPVIGWLRLAERNYVPLNPERIAAATISRQASNWFVSVLVEEEAPRPQEPRRQTLGVDLGVKSALVCSDGSVFDNLKLTYKYERKLARLNKELVRRRQGGQNWLKTKTKLQRVHAKIANARQHMQHDGSAHVVYRARPAVIVLEDLNVSGMLKNRHLSKAIADVGFGELRRQIEYKAAWVGVDVVTADRWYPSSKTCSECGAVKPLLKLSERMFVCEECGAVLDRDLNAARNLAALGEPVNTGGLPVELEPLGSTVKQEAGGASDD